jgi:hypothetical protein
MEAGNEKGIEMTRNLKIIGLASLAATIAVASALAATGAFAGEEEAEGGGWGNLSAAGYPAILDGEDIPSELNAFTLGGRVIKCPNSTYTGEISGEVPSFTITPTYNNCSEPINNRKVTIAMNGCDYKLTLRKTTIQGNEFVDNYFFTTEINCPANKDIEIQVYEADNENAKNCLFTIKEQTLKDRGKLQNTLDNEGDTDGGLKLEKHLENIAATQSGSCGSKEITTGRYHIGITIKGTTKVGGPNFLEVTDGEE